MGDVIVRYVDLPCTVRGLTILSTDGCYNIYINSRLSQEMRSDAIRHELTHINRDDFYRQEEPLSLVESM